MPFQGDVFGLNSVYDKQVENVDNNNFESWPEGATYGYYAGGYSTYPNHYSWILRLDFSNESVSNPGNNLPTSMQSIGGIYNSTYGYFGGGYYDPAVYISEISRLDYSNETVSLPGNNLPSNRAYTSTVQNNIYGYYCGGYVPGSVNTISRFDFSNETTSDPGKNLNNSRNISGNLSSSSYGYIIGSSSPPPLSTIERLDFSTEVVSLTGKNIPSAVGGMGSVWNSNFGYVSGGGLPIISTVVRLDFSSETVSSPGKNLPSARRVHSATQSSVYGYFGGGYVPPGPAASSIIVRLDFSSEVVTDPGNRLTIGTRDLTGISGGAKSVYRSKGYKTYGYYGGGTKSPSPPYNTSSIERIDFSTENVNVISAKVSSAVSGLHGVSNNYYGYFSGGNAVGVGNYSYVTRLDFSNETTNKISNAPSSIVTTVPLSNSQYGYIYSLNTSDIVRFDYSAETYLLLNSKTLSNRFDSATGSHGSYGYVMSGGYRSSIERLDFSNELVTELLSTVPYAALGPTTGVSNNSYLYLGGGTPDGSLQDSRVARLDFSTENVSLPGNPISPARYSASGTSANYYGYFAGGYGPSYNNTISRLDFSSETTQNPGKNVSLLVTSMMGIENSN